MRKRSNRKKGSKRVREGVSRMITVLQMDFQGRRELEVAKTGLSRYRKKNVIAFAKWANLLPIQVVPQRKSVLFRSFNLEQDFFYPTLNDYQKKQEETDMKHFKSMKRTLAIMSCAALLAGCSSSSASQSASSSASSAAGSSAALASSEVYSIGLAQLVDHPSLNTIREAFLSEMEDEGYKEGENITINYQNAAGKTSNLDSIMSGYQADDVNAIVAIATPTAMAAQNYSENIPVIFSAVSDPVGAGLVETIEKPGGNITGTSDEIQVEQIVDLMLELSPDVKTVGVLYNPGEANSVSNINRFKKYAESKGLTVTEKTGTDNTTMQQAAVELTNSADAIFSPNDNTVATGMVSLAQVARDAGIPYYVGADSMVETGGFATMGINYEDLGRETAKMTIDVLKGESPADMPVKVFKDNLNIYINEDVLKDLEEKGKTKVAVPEEIKSQDNLKMVATSEK